MFLDREPQLVDELNVFSLGLVNDSSAFYQVSTADAAGVRAAVLDFIAKRNIWIDPAQRTVNSLDDKNASKASALGLCRVFYRADPGQHRHQQRGEECDRRQAVEQHQAASELHDGVADDERRRQHTERTDGGVSRQPGPDATQHWHPGRRCCNSSSKSARKTRKTFDETKSEDLSAHTQPTRSRWSSTRRSGESKPPTSPAGAASGRRSGSGVCR